MIKLDPALLDQDKIRHAKRKKLWMILAAPLGIVLILALFYLRTGLANIGMSTGDNSNRYGFARGLIRMQKVSNLLEPYIAYYNSGYISLVEAEDVDALKKAEEEFKESLKHDPPEKMLCSIYVNLSYSLELQADLKMENKEYDDVLVAYDQAVAVLFENGCASRKDDGSEKDKTAQEAKKRIEDKKKKALDAFNEIEDESEDDGDEPQKKEETMNKEAIEKIKQMQEELNRTVQNDVRSSYAAGGKYSIDFNEPNW